MSTPHPDPATVVACTLTPADVAARRDSLLPGLATRAVQRIPTPDGYRLQFAASPDLVRAIGETIDAERHCCRFLRFAVVVEPDGGFIELALSGPPGTREFLDALLDT